MPRARTRTRTHTHTHTQVLDVVEDEVDPRKITVTVRATGLFSRAHTWRFCSDNRRQIDAISRAIRAAVEAPRPRVAGLLGGEGEQ
jgi:hypothetical protein